MGTGFLGHELAHKFTAEKYGCWAEFKLWTYGALMALLSAIKKYAGALWTVEVEHAWAEAYTIMARTMLDAAAADDGPAWWSATLIDYERRARDLAVVSLMGPLINVAAALAFLAGYVAAHLTNLPIVIGTLNGTFSFFQQGVRLNLLLAAFNMLPIFILDGQKVYAWDKRTWALLAVPLWIAALTIPSLLI